MALQARFDDWLRELQEIRTFSQFCHRASRLSLGEIMHEFRRSVSLVLKLGVLLYGIGIVKVVFFPAGIGGSFAPGTKTILKGIFWLLVIVGTLASWRSLLEGWSELFDILRRLPGWIVGQWAGSFAIFLLCVMWGAPWWLTLAIALLLFQACDFVARLADLIVIHSKSERTQRTPADANSS